MGGSFCETPGVLSGIEGASFSCRKECLSDIG